VDATTRERTAKQEGIRPVPYLLTVLRPLVSPQLIVSVAKKTVLRPTDQLQAFPAERNTQFGAFLPISTSLTFVRFQHKQGDSAGDLVQEAEGAVDEGAAVQVLPYQRALQPNRRDLLM